MLIDCPSCARSYNVSRAALGESGRTVICPACETRWFAEPTLSRALPNRAGLGAPSATTFGVRSDAIGQGAARLARLPPARPSSGAGAVLVGLACLLIAMGAIAKRATIVRTLPRTAALYDAIGLPVNVRGLTFGTITTTRFDEVGRSVEIAGTVRNIAQTRNAVPKITFAFRDAKGATLASWTDTTPKRVLASDETIAFSTQAPVLPEGTKDVVVRFESEADHAAKASGLLIPKAH